MGRSSGRQRLQAQARMEAEQRVAVLQAEGAQRRAQAAAWQGVTDRVLAGLARGPAAPALGTL